VDHDEKLLRVINARQQIREPLSPAIKLNP